MPNSKSHSDGVLYCEACNNTIPKGLEEMLNLTLLPQHRAYRHFGRMMCVVVGLKFTAMDLGDKA